MFLSMLSCKETVARLDDYLDRELSPDEVQLVEKHLRLCRHCAEKFAFEGDWLRELKTKVQRLETDDAQVTAILQRIKAALPEPQKP